MVDDGSFSISDPELEDRNEKYSAALMGAASGQIMGLVVLFVGLVGGFMSDQTNGLENTGIGMGLFAAFSFLHYAISRHWLGGADRERLQANLPFFLFALFGVVLYFYATFSDTEWVSAGFLGGILFVILLGKGILAIEKTPPKSRKTTYILSPFERNSLIIVVLVGSMLGVGVGMNSEGHREIGHGPFARTFLSETISSAHHQVAILLFGVPRSYRLRKGLLAAKSKGLSVRVLVTAQAASAYATDLLALRKAGIPVRILPDALPSYIRPFALIDRRILLTGSGGWGSLTTDGGNEMKMTANLLALPKIHLFLKNFDSLWNRSTPLAPKGTVPS